MSYNNQTKVQSIFQIITIVVSIIVIAAFLFTAINAKWNLVTSDVIVHIVAYIRYFGSLAVCSLLLLDYAITRSVTFQVLMCILIAGAIIFQFIVGGFDKLPLI